MPPPVLLQPQVLIEQPQGPFEQPRVTLKQPHLSLEQPQGPLEQPQGTYVQPHIPLEQPQGPLARPRVCSQSQQSRLQVVELEKVETWKITLHPNYPSSITAYWIAAIGEVERIVIEGRIGYIVMETDGEWKRYITPQPITSAKHRDLTYEIKRRSDFIKKCASKASSDELKKHVNAGVRRIMQIANSDQIPAEKELTKFQLTSELREQMQIAALTAMKDLQMVGQKEIQRRFDKAEKLLVMTPEMFDVADQTEDEAKHKIYRLAWKGRPYENEIRKVAAEGLNLTLACDNGPEIEFIPNLMVEARKMKDVVPEAAPLCLSILTGAKIEHTRSDANSAKYNAMAFTTAGVLTLILRGGKSVKVKVGKGEIVLTPDTMRKWTMEFTSPFFETVVFANWITGK